MLLNFMLIAFALKAVLLQAVMVIDSEETLCLILLMSLGQSHRQAMG